MTEARTGGIVRGADGVGTSFGGGSALKRSKLLKLGLAIGMISALPAATASACQEPNLFVPQNRVSAGDPVNFSISGTEVGATYTVHVGGPNGPSVGQFSDTDPALGTSGSFTMPDMGSSEIGDLEVTALVDHQGIQYSPRDFVDYVPPAAPANPAPPSGTSEPGSPATNGAPASQSHHVPAKTTAGSPVSGPGHASGDDGSGGTAAPAAAPVAPVSATFGRSRQTSGTSASEPPSSAAAAPAATHRRTTAEPRSSHGAANAVHQADSSVSSASHEAVGPAREVAVPAHAGRATPGAIIGGGVTLLAAMAGACFVFLRRRGGPAEDHVAAKAPLWTPPSVRAEADWRTAVIEAELQEMIAEERAKELVPARPAQSIEALEHDREPRAIA